MAESSFAETQLKKYGWSRGKGLGKNLEGRSKAITVKQKKDSAGVRSINCLSKVLVAKDMPNSFEQYDLIAWSWVL